MGRPRPSLLSADVLICGLHGLDAIGAVPNTECMERTVLIAGFAGVQALDMVGPFEVFTGATLYLSGRGADGYGVRVVSVDGQPVSTGTGLTFVAEPLPDPDNEIVEYSDGDNHGTLVYALNAVSVSISVGGDGVTLSWNNYWGQIYTVMESSNLEEWTPTAGYEGILSARDVDGSITNTVTIPFGDEMKFFKLRVDQQ